VVHIALLPLTNDRTLDRVLGCGIAHLFCIEYSERKRPAPWPAEVTHPAVSGRSGAR
jgi:hypothetical protein